MCGSGDLMDVDGCFRGVTGVNGIHGDNIRYGSCPKIWWIPNMA